jgi:hypothetical protein
MKQSSLTVGVDVPWVTSWTAEPIVGVRRCASVGGRPALAQNERAGFGRPEYSKNHLLRQRLSVGRMLCPMCGAPTPPDDRWTQVARLVAAGRLRRQGKGDGLGTEIEDARILLNAGSIAPLHRACVDRSLAHCPHLKADPNVEVMRFPARWTVTPLLIPAEADGASAPVPVIAFLQLCGITDRLDRDWRVRTRLRAPALQAA